MFSQLNLYIVVNTLDRYLYSILTVKCIILNSVFVVLENGLFEVSESVHINGHRCMVAVTKEMFKSNKGVRQHLLGCHHMKKLVAPVPQVENAP